MKTKLFLCLLTLFGTLNAETSSPTCPECESTFRKCTSDYCYIVDPTEEEQEQCAKCSKDQEKCEKNCQKGAPAKANAKKNQTCPCFNRGANK